MPDIRIVKAVRFPPDEVVRRLESELLGMPNLKMFIETHRVVGHTIEFGGSRGIEGSARAEDGRLVVDIRLSEMTRMMRRMIESRVGEALDRIFTA